MPSIENLELERVAVFRALNLGDLLCAVPALRAIRWKLPEANIHLIGLAHMAPLAMRLSKYISSFASFPGCPGLPEQTFELESFTRFLHEEARARHELVIQMHGKGSVTNPLVCMLGAERVAGYYEPGEFCPDEALFMPYPGDLPEIERHLRLIEYLGFPRQGSHLEFPLTAEDWASLETLRGRKGFSHDEYVCVHPGARDVRRWWAPKKFARVADSLARKGLRIVFTGSTAESAAIDEVRERMNQSSINLVGQTDLGALGALIARARLLVSNDTGVSHIAAATCTPSVVVFLASDPHRWAPLDRETHRVIRSSGADVAGVLSEAELALGRVTRPASPEGSATRS